jgi:tRNA threonylcarbamoyladenosine biosynthesis protein TsaE
VEIISSSARETREIGKNLARGLGPGSVVALYGDLGAGKTAFVQGLAEGLGIKARVTSPTFSIVNEYAGRLPLFHFDLYRLSSADDLYEIGWDEYLDRGGICAVEWSENAEGVFDIGVIKVRITTIDAFTRKISIEE